MTPTLRELIRERVEKLNSIPTVPAIIRPLLFYLERPVDQVEVQRIVDLVIVRRVDLRPVPAGGEFRPVFPLA